MIKIYNEASKSNIETRADWVEIAHVFNSIKKSCYTSLQLKNLYNSINKSKPREQSIHISMPNPTAVSYLQSTLPIIAAPPDSHEIERRVNFIQTEKQQFAPSNHSYEAINAVKIPISEKSQEWSSDELKVLIKCTENSKNYLKSKLGSGINFKKLTDSYLHQCKKIKIDTPEQVLYQRDKNQIENKIKHLRNKGTIK